MEIEVEVNPYTHRCKSALIVDRFRLTDNFLPYAFSCLQWKWCFRRHLPIEMCKLNPDYLVRTFDQEIRAFIGPNVSLRKIREILLKPLQVEKLCFFAHNIRTQEAKAAWS